MHPRVLIVGTVPYNTKSTSRAFDAYFHYWEKENIAQIFSNTKKPCKGHCETLFQITDHRVLQRWMGKKVDTGVSYHYDDLDTEWKDNDLELGFWLFRMTILSRRLQCMSPRDITCQLSPALAMTIISMWKRR